MSLSPKISLSLGNKCNKISANDVTGIYDPVSNTGGWGVPNTENFDITSAIIGITTDDTITDADDCSTIYDVTSELIGATVTNSFNILFEEGFSEGDGIYYAFYKVTGPLSIVSQTETTNLFICNLLNCKDNLVIKLIDACTSAEVTRLKEQVDQMEIFIYGIQTSFEIEDYDTAENILTAAQKYCQVVTECKTC